MRLYTSLAAIGLVAVTQATGTSKEKGSAPPNCSPDFSGKFEMTVIRLAGGKRSVEKRGALEMTLEGGILKDSLNRTGYIADNYQFQFDGPPQAGAIIVDGWSACTNGSLALGSSTVFYQCLSGDFYNLYTENWAAQCEGILLGIMPMDGGSSGSVSQISDGQVQNPTAHPVTQIGDGQIQAPTGRPVSQIGDGQIQAPTGHPSGAPVTQIGDGQIQAPTGSAPGQTAPSPPPPAATSPPPMATSPPVTTPNSNSTFVVIPSPPNTSTRGNSTTVRPSAGSRTLPGTVGALFLAALGAFLYL